MSLSDRLSSSRSSSCGRLTKPTVRKQITTSLLSATKAVSQKLKNEAKRKCESESSEVGEEDEDEDYEEFETYDTYRSYEDYEMPVTRRAYRRQAKRARFTSSNRERRKKNERSGEEDKEKRDMHNNMERMRRIDLRVSFDELKAVVPEVAHRDRAPKVAILREAAIYCKELRAQSQSQLLQVQTLRNSQMMLRTTVSSLRKDAAKAVRIRQH